MRGDLPLFRNRLKLVGGVRAEQTNVAAAGPLTDVTRNYQRNAAGAPILAANGRPVPIASDPLQTSILTLLDRGRELLDFGKMEGDGFFKIEVPPGADGALWKFEHCLGQRLLMTVPPYLARSGEELLLPREVVEADTPRK